MRLIDADELKELYNDPEIKGYSVPVEVILANIDDMLTILENKPRIIIEFEEMPKDCYCCNQVDEFGYCRWVNKYVDHVCKVGERYSTCPIEQLGG